MTDFTEQILRIKIKLQQAKEKDKYFKVFGAGSHKYELRDPLSVEEVENLEKKYQIQLPECYRSFMLNFGNGGKSFLNSGAGPFLGIYPFGQSLDNLIYNNVEKYLKKECVLHPQITEMQWEKLTDPLYEDDITDEDYEALNGTLYGGILPLGSQGCSYIHALILNGPYKGMVVNMERSGLSPPKFSEDKNFLDWYERWLNEIISGKLITTSPSWFGYPKN